MDLDGLPASGADLRAEVIRRSGPQDRLLVLIHGYGESSAMLTDRLDELDPAARFVAVAPTGPFEKKGRPIWHRALGGENPDAVRQFLVSHRLLHEFVDHMGRQLGFARPDAVVGGFSQGAGLAVALTIAPLGRPRPAGCLAFCGFAPPVPGLRVPTAERVGTPIFLTAASADRFMTVDVGRQSADLLAGLGAPVTYHELDGGHEITDEAVAQAASWIDEVLAGGRPSTSLPGVGVNPLRAWADDAWVTS